MTLDAKMRPLATKLVAKNGKSVTLTSITVGAYDPATGAATPTSTPATVKAVVSDYSTRRDGAGFTAGLILSGDKKFSIAAEGITKPKPGDTITLDGVVYAVVRVTETWSGELVALFDIQARI